MSREVGLLTEEDREALGARSEQVEAWLDQLAAGPTYRHLDRPCTIGDGLVDGARLDDPAIYQSWQEAAHNGRVQHFVPASGAATRLLGALRASLEGHAPLDEAALEEQAILIRAAGRLPFWSSDAPHSWEGLEQSLQPVVAGLPKALLPFHTVDSELRTAFVEHLHEALALSGHGQAWVHFTVSPHAMGRFEAAAAEAQERLPQVRVHFTVQDPTTNLPALLADGSLPRRPDGHLLLRPGGHGSLLGNLSEGNPDLLTIKNIDNVVHPDRRSKVLRWRRRLVGLAAHLQSQVHEAMARLSQGDGLHDANTLLLQWFHRSPAANPEQALEALDRPLRVCAMVPNHGQPGGGPFWVRGDDGRRTKQVVEKAEIDVARPSQRGCLQASTHFNPVDLVCAMRRPDGSLYDLSAYTNPKAILTGQKVWRGRPIRIIERPGLWNGSMEGWNTVFVAVPSDVFAPVKHISDLLAPAHQPLGDD